MSLMSTFVNDPFFASDITGLNSDPFLNRRLLSSGLIPSTGGVRSTVGGMVFKMSVDVLDGDKEYIVMAELPGVPKDKVDVMIENNVLTIKAEKIQPPNMLPAQFHYDISELNFGTDTRRIRLPLNIDQDSAETCFHDGCLCIKFKKMEHLGCKKLEIKA
eukprot:gene30182-37351_t